MASVDHVREAETHLEAATQAQPTDEAALLVARAQVHATLAAVEVAQEQTPSNPAVAAPIVPAAATAGSPDQNGASGPPTHLGGDS